MNCGGGGSCGTCIVEASQLHLSFFVSGLYDLISDYRVEDGDE